jgi:hypothetical protein
MYIPGFMTIDSGIQVILSNFKHLKIFDVGIIDENNFDVRLCQSDGLRWYDTHTRFHKDRSRTSEVLVVKGET